MKLDLYSRDGCGHCSNVKDILKYRQIQFNEYTIGVDISTEKIKEICPEAKYLPIIILNGKWVENISDLRFLLGDE